MFAEAKDFDFNQVTVNLVVRRHALYSIGFCQLRYFFVDLISGHAVAYSPYYDTLMYVDTVAPYDTMNVRQLHRLGYDIGERRHTYLGGYFELTGYKQR